MTSPRGRLQRHLFNIFRVNFWHRLLFCSQAWLNSMIWQNYGCLRLSVQKGQKVNCVSVLERENLLKPFFTVRLTPTNWEYWSHQNWIYCYWVLNLPVIHVCSQSPIWIKLLVFWESFLSWFFILFDPIMVEWNTDQ